MSNFVGINSGSIGFFPASQSFPSSFRIPCKTSKYYCNMLLFMTSWEVNKQPGRQKNHFVVPKMKESYKHYHIERLKFTPRGSWKATWCTCYKTNLPNHVCWSEEKVYIIWLVNICTGSRVGGSQISSEELIWEGHMGNFVSFLVI